MPPRRRTSRGHWQIAPVGLLKRHIGSGADAPGAVDQQRRRVRAHNLERTPGHLERSGATAARKAMNSQSLSPLGIAPMMQGGDRHVERAAIGHTS